MATAQLDAKRFEELIFRRGRPILWEEACMCSCWSLTSGQPSYSCAACHGKGYVYTGGVQSVSLVTSVALSKDFQDMAGVFEVGDAIMTVPKHTIGEIIDTGLKGLIDNPVFDIGLWDRITLLDDEYKDSEILVKGTAINGREADTLINTKITSVKSVIAYSAATGAAVSYINGTDYTITDNKVVWVEGGSSPAEGAQYSVVYFHRPVYVVCATLPKPRHQDGQDLPRYVALRYLEGGIEKK